MSEPTACERGDRDDCEARCAGDDAASCSSLVDVYAHGLRPVDAGRATRLFEGECRARHAAACTLLGRAYLEPFGVTRDARRAAELFSLACDLGDMRGCFELGLRTEDAKKASSLIEHACDAGVPSACERARATRARVGAARASSCRDGFVDACVDGAMDAVADDPVGAQKELRKICDDGFARACVSLSTLPSRGAWPPLGLRRACEGGEGTTCFHALPERPSPAAVAKAIDAAERSCLHGDYAVCDELARVIEKASFGVEADAVRAEGLYRQGCDAGHASSCADLAKLLAGQDPVDVDLVVEALATGCEADDAAACRGAAMRLEDHPDRDPGKRRRQLATRGCDLGDGAACVVLSRLAGLDLNAAARALDRGCATGSTSACLAFAALVRDGIGVAKEPERARSLEETACEKGGACFALGITLEHGRGGPKDVARARELYQRSCAAGDVRGCWMVAADPEALRRVCASARTARKDDDPTIDEDPRSLACPKPRRTPGDTSREDAAAIETECTLAVQGGPEARRDHASSCAALADLFDAGIAVKRDVGRAIDLRSIACQGGHVASCSRYGVALAEGRSVTKDRAAAVRLLRRGCDLKDPTACTELKRLGEKVD